MVSEIPAEHQPAHPVPTYKPTLTQPRTQQRFLTSPTQYLLWILHHAWGQADGSEVPTISCSSPPLSRTTRTKWEKRYFLVEWGKLFPGKEEVHSCLKEPRHHSVDKYSVTGLITLIGMWLGSQSGQGIITAWGLLQAAANGQAATHCNTCVGGVGCFLMPLDIIPLCIQLQQSAWMSRNC